MSVSAEQVKINKIAMSSDRLTKPLILASSTSSPLVLEVNIFEHINQPFLTGTLVFQDDQDIFRLAEMSGTERIEFEFESIIKEKPPVSKSFVITSINSTKTNDNTSLLSCSLIEDIGYYEMLSNYSKSYTGKGEDIIKSIVRDKFSKEFDERLYKPSRQSAFRYNIPYQTPFNAIKTILSKMTTDNGLPYFFHSTLNSEKFILTDMETILGREPFNSGSPFVYSQAMVNNPSDRFENQIYNIAMLETGDNEDTLALAMSGAIGSRFIDIDITTGKANETHIDVLQTVKDLSNLNLMSDPTQKTPLVDELFTPDPTGSNSGNISTYDPVRFSGISMGTFNGVNSFTEEDTLYDSKLQIIREGILNHLMKNQMSIYVPGFVFSDGNPLVSVGNQINISILRNTPTPTGDKQTIDEKRSGNFIVMAKRYLFNISNETLNVSIEVGRINNIEKMN